MYNKQDSVRLKCRNFYSFFGFLFSSILISLSTYRRFGNGQDSFSIEKNLSKKTTTARNTTLIMTRPGNRPASYRNQQGFSPPFPVPSIAVDSARRSLLLLHPLAVALKAEAKRATHTQKARDERWYCIARARASVGKL